MSKVREMSIDEALKNLQTCDANMFAAFDALVTAEDTADTVNKDAKSKSEQKTKANGDVALAKKAVRAAALKYAEGDRYYRSAQRKTLNTDPLS